MSRNSRIIMIGIALLLLAAVVSYGAHKRGYSVGGGLERDTGLEGPVDVLTPDIVGISTTASKFFTVGPEKVLCSGVGIRECLVVNGKLFYDEIEGFSYEPGFVYEVEVRVHILENPPADASAVRYEMVRVVSQQKSEVDPAAPPSSNSAQETAIPEGCTNWFDGCNSCIVGEEGLLGCTRKACAVLQEPRCLKFQ